MRRPFTFSIFAAILVLLPAGYVVAQKKAVSFWTTEIAAKRLDIQQALAKRFEQAAGVAVDVVPVKERINSTDGRLPKEKPPVSDNFTARKPLSGFFGNIWTATLPMRMPPSG